MCIEFFKLWRHRVPGGSARSTTGTAGFTSNPPKVQLGIDVRSIQNTIVNLRKIFLQSDSLHICHEKNHNLFASSFFFCFIQFRIDEAPVKVKGTPVPLEGLHVPINLRVQQFLLWSTGGNMGSSFDSVGFSSLTATTWAAFSLFFYSIWWKVHIYALAQDANFSILCFVNTFVGQVQSFTSCLKLLLPRLLDTGNRL